MAAAGRHRARVSLAAALSAVALLAAACGSASPAQEEAQTKAEQWFHNFHEGERQGVDNLFSFYDSGVRLDHRGRGYAEISGRTAALAYLRADWEGFRRIREPQAPVYLSAEGVVDHVRFEESGLSVDAAFVDAMTPLGIGSETYTRSEASWRRFQPEDRRWDQLHQRLMAYVVAWSSGTPAAVSALYAPTATVEDSLLGLTLAGDEAVRAAAAGPAAQGGLRTAKLEAIPDLGGPALFGAGPNDGLDTSPLDTAVVLFAVDEGRGCPGEMAAVLRLDPQGLITAEQRYHRVDALLRCSADGALPSGWWDAITVPPAVTVAHSGTMNVTGREVEVYNGTAGLEGLAGWAFGRFAEAGLAVPAVDRVTFMTAADLCEGIRGLAGGGRVTLCYGADQVCLGEGCKQWRPYAKATALHEWAHQWIADRVDASTQQRLVEQAGLETWDSLDSAWGDRGVEWAAEIMAWGLMDEAYDINQDLGLPPCAERAALFGTLTGGRAPLSATCPSA